MATLAPDTRPQNVPADRVHDIDMYALADIAEGFHEAWSKACPPGTPDLIWTPRTGGHWIATNGETIREIYSDPVRFSSECHHNLAHPFRRRLLFSSGLQPDELQ